MRSLDKAVWLWASFGLLALLAVLGFAGRDDLLFTFTYTGTRADWELRKIRIDWDRAYDEFHEAKRSAKTPADVVQARDQYSAEQRLLSQRCLALAKKYPDTVAELGALYFAACCWPNTEDGKKAGETLAQRAASADMEHLARLFALPHPFPDQRVRMLGPLILDRVKKNPNHHKAAQLLADVCQLTEPDTDTTEAPAAFVEAADLIAERYADSPDIEHFCEVLGIGFGSPPWTGRFEEHLRTILSKNQDRWVRVSASFALASVVQGTGESRQVEAEQLYQHFVEKFDGTEEYSSANLEKELNRRAKLALEELKSRALGKPAPGIEGVDLDGRPMKLSEYRGKVVLLNFWATWCFPCMKLIPLERELVTRFKDKPFAIVGVNSDTDVQAAIDAARAHEMTWRSFRDKSGDNTKISDDWKILGYPTLYLIDQEGTIRKRWIGNPAPGQLRRAIEQLLDSAAKHAPADEIESPTSTVPKGKSPRMSSRDNFAADEARGQQTGFIDRVYQAPDGYEAKYVVFVPHSYDSEKAFPVILFLHGAGYEGRNGRDQLTGALAQAIRNNEETFAFITVFPQAHVGDWQADSDDGKRALAILDELEKDYAVDAKRVYLTGLSMGGEGTWSLAAAHPDRWAAIVPICGEGDPRMAAKIKDIPCWCFHGDADKMIRVQLSRDMIGALRKAGGRPLYHEYPGVGHNCWDRTYAKADLYEWLMLQERM